MVTGESVRLGSAGQDSTDRARWRQNLNLILTAGDLSQICRLCSNVGLWVCVGLTLSVHSAGRQRVAKHTPARQGCHLTAHTMVSCIQQRDDSRLSVLLLSRVFHTLASAPVDCLSPCRPAHSLLPILSLLSPLVASTSLAVLSRGRRCPCPPGWSSGCRKTAGGPGPPCARARPWLHLLVPPAAGTCLVSLPARQSEPAGKHWAGQQEVLASQGEGNLGEPLKVTQAGWL